MSLEIHSHSSSPMRPLHQSLTSEIPSQPLKSSRGNVKFASTIEHTRFIESVKELSKKEKDKRWVSAEVFHDLKAESRVILDTLKRSDSFDIFMYRGLEMVDPEATTRRQRRNTDAIGAVLIEQREQRQKGKRNPKSIRKVYKKLVTDSMKEALENAYVDKKAVQEYLSTAIEEVNQEHREQKTNRKPAKKSIDLSGRSPSNPNKRAFGGLFSKRTVTLSCSDSSTKSS